MRFEILRNEVSSTSRALFLWCLGVLAAASLYQGLYGSIAGLVSGPNSMVSQMPEALTKTVGFDAIVTGAGYAQSTLYGLLGFVLITIASISWGSSAVAGAEENGRLELTLAHSVSRSGYYLNMLLALLIRTAAMAATAGLATWAWNVPSHLNIDLENIAPMVLAYWLLGLSAGAASLSVGAMTGSRKAAAGAGAALAVTGYVLNALGHQNPDWEWMHRFSPYHWAFGNSPLTHGLDGAGALYLALLVGAVIVLGLLVFRRRDLT